MGEAADRGTVGPEAPEPAGPGDRVPASAYGDPSCPHMGHVDITFSLDDLGEPLINVELGGAASGDLVQEITMMRSAVTVLNDLLRSLTSSAN